MSKLIREELDHPYLYDAQAITNRRFKKNTNYVPDSRMIFLDSRGATVNSQIPSGLLQFTCELGGSPIRRTARLFMNRVWGVISTPNIMNNSPGSILAVQVDGIDSAPVQLPTKQMDITEWGGYLLGVIHAGGAPAATMSIDSIRRTITINTAPHTWNFKPGFYPVNNIFASFPTVPALINVVSGLQMFRTRYVTVQVLLSASRLLSSSATNGNILGSSSAVFNVKDPSAPAYINEFFGGMPSFGIDFNDVFNSVTVNFFDEFGAPLVCGPTDWMMTVMHSEE